MSFLDYIKNKARIAGDYFGVGEKGLGKFGSQVVNPVRNMASNQVANFKVGAPIAQQKIKSGINFLTAQGVKNQENSRGALDLITSGSPLRARNIPTKEESRANDLVQREFVKTLKSGNVLGTFTGSYQKNLSPETNQLARNYFDKQSNVALGLTDPLKKVGKVTSLLQKGLVQETAGQKKLGTQAPTPKPEPLDTLATTASPATSRIPVRINRQSFDETIPQKVKKRQLSDTEVELQTSRNYLDNLITSEAKILRDYEEAGGVGILKKEKVDGQGGGIDYSRFSEHGREYRDYFKKYGRKPPLSFWKDMAARNIEKGSSDLAGEYKAIKEYVQSLDEAVKAELSDMSRKKPIAGLLEQPKPTTLLPQGRPNTPIEAKNIFKKTGDAVDFVNVQKGKDKPFIFSEKTGESKNIKVRVTGGDGKEITVKINALNDVSPETVKDISGIDASFKSVYRNFEKAFGRNFEAVKRRILDPFDSSKGNMVREQAQLADDLANNIVKKLGINKGSKESALVQQFGEGKLTLDQLKGTTDKWQNIVEADKWFRAQYDRLLDEVNATRAKIYPNNLDKQIPRRNDYYRHFQELSGLQGLKNLFDSPANIPTELAGVSDTTAPKSKFLSFAQKRLGFKTKDDAVGGFINYMRSATYAKHIDQHIEKFRGLANELRDMAKNGDDPTVGSRFAEYLDDYANDLSGKTNALDRSAQKIIGRKGFAVINWLNSRVKANVILGNLSSSVAQAGNTPQMMAKAGYKNWAKGFKDLLDPKNKVIDESSFIKERYAGSLFDQFDTKLLDQPKKLAVWITQSLDELATKIGWNGFYRQAVEKGIPNPIKYADDFTRSMVGGRGVGEVPLIQKAKVTQLVAPFQLEVQNLMQVLGKEVKNKEFGVLLKYTLAAYAFNRAAEAVRGNGVTFDPAQAVIDSVKAYQEEDNKGIGALRAGGRLAGEVASNMMGGQQLAALYPEYGVKVGDETVTRKELFGKKDPTRFGQGLIASAVQNPAYKILPPFGGAQAEKTIEGASSFIEGSVKNKSGKEQYQIDQTPSNYAKSLLFGKYATSNAKNYFNKPKEDKKNLKESKVYGDKITLTEDGKYKYTTKGEEHTTSDIQTAKVAIDKEDFRKSGKNIEERKGKVFRLQKDGDVKIQPKDEYDYSLNTKKLTKLKSAGDLKGWFDTADKQLAILDKQMQNTTLDELELSELQAKADTIISNYKKYDGYGGFTKPNKPKSNKQKYAKLLATARSLPSAKISINVTPKARRARKVKLYASKR